MSHGFRSIFRASEHNCGVWPRPRPCSSQGCQAHDEVTQLLWRTPPAVSPKMGCCLHFKAGRAAYERQIRAARDSDAS